MGFAAICSAYSGKNLNATLPLTFAEMMLAARKALLVFDPIAAGEGKFAVSDCLT
jgi:hypothetical protein